MSGKEYDMRNLKLVTSILLILVLVGNMCAIACAHDIQGDDAICDDSDVVISPEVVGEPRMYGNCSTCGEFTVLMCVDESEFFSTRTHFSLKGTCTMTIYRSTGYRYCIFCDKIFERYDPHLCWEFHSTCALYPLYNTCPMNYKENDAPWLD